MKVHQLSAEEVIASLRSMPGGISSAEAGRRLREYGPNLVRKIEREPLLLRFFKEFTSFF